MTQLNIAGVTMVVVWCIRAMWVDNCSGSVMKVVVLIAVIANRSSSLNIKYSK